VIAILVFVCAVSGLAPLVVPRALRAERKRYAHWLLQQAFNRMAFNLERTAIAIGEVMLPALRKVAAAFQKMAEDLR
jgi:hypothetical protein